ncbi:hypothetical protein KNV00_gp116 [Streptomyces phage Bmoc]|uniref:Uncharacterized protein n=1 Tax=Streptomyces phage Bmoc TaxID=2725629 RepID=A0A6M3SY32_9CAUD|nr:hypothetical protein KNV00_gp116 [Streptomyces phage Bmoc]QJD50903.1 hypothetical protein SEA_BMOC_189 [Streptomyces phage Bmoc]
MRTYEPDEWTLEMALGRAMDNDGLTYGEALAILLITEGRIPWNNNPGVFKGYKLKEQNAYQDGCEIGR